jgi:hypothetical protein
MASSSDQFRQQREARRANLTRPGIAMFDPVDNLPKLEEPESKKGTVQHGTAEEQKNSPAVKPPAKRPTKQPKAQTTAPTETPVKMGWHMYPSRHKQVLYEALRLDMKPWEINELALAEYFERHSRTETTE